MPGIDDFTHNPERHVDFGCGVEAALVAEGSKILDVLPVLLARLVRRANLEELFDRWTQDSEVPRGDKAHHHRDRFDVAKDPQQPVDDGVLALWEDGQALDGVTLTSFVEFLLRRPLPERAAALSANMTETPASFGITVGRWR